MYCRKCGTWCEDDAVFCTQCGEVLGEKTTHEQTTYSTMSNQQNMYNVNYEGGSFMTAQYAGFWKRFLAYLIDGFIVGIVNFIIGFVLGAIGLDGIVTVVGVAIAWVYYAYMESSEYQATLGKMALNMRVVDYDGQRISFARATGRYFSKILSGFILCIGYLMAAWTERKQGLHDMIAGTLVINE